MASKYTKIPRAISEFKLFLDYNNEDYYDVFRNVKPWKGLAVSSNSDIYPIVDNLEGNLYESIYPKLIEENPASDEEILNSFKGALKLFLDSNRVFEKISKKELFFSTEEGLVHTLLIRVIYKLKEVIQLAEEDIIRDKNESANTILPESPNSLNAKYLIGIVVATSLEFECLHENIVNPNMLPTEDDDSQVYYSGTIEENGKVIEVIFTQCHHQGTAAASTTTTKLLKRFKPSMIAMLGHCAGNKNLLKALKLGDVLVCSEAIDYDQVSVIEIIKDGVTEIKEKDRKIPIPSDSTLINLIERYASDLSILESIKESFVQKSAFNDPLSFKVGKLISGDALVRSENWFNKIISDNTGAVGLDMETYGVYYSSEHTLFKNKPLFVSIKSVSDYGSHKKDFPLGLEDHNLRVAYAVHTSVHFFLKFAATHLPI